VRVERVITNRTCNMKCGFCTARRAAEDRAFVAPEAVRRRIAEAARGGGEVVLTGGEPTMRRDLAELVAQAHAGGASEVTLETNGALVDDGLAGRLAGAGLDRARVHLPRLDDGLDAITRDPGGFRGTLRGLEALAAAGVPIEASAPVVRSTADTLPALPRALVDSGLPFEQLLVGVPVESPDPDELLPLREAARVIAAAEAGARSVGLALRLSQDALLPPCLFDRPARVAHLYTLTPGGGRRAGHAKLDGCAPCVAADRCPGFPEAALARERIEPRPIGEDRVRRRLSIISSIDDQIARELHQDDVYRRDGGVAIPARIVRVNFHCNQSCRFCFVSTHLPRARDEAVERAIVEIAERGGVLVLSGGEPTLNPRLLDYVRLGRARGAAEIEIQTNAIRMADTDLARKLADAGVDQCFVSLHGSRAELSDAVTEAPGTFDRTVRGLDRIAETGMRTRINFVFCQRNQHDFPTYVERVAERWPDAAICVSFVAASTDVVPRTPDLVPRYTDVLPHLTEGLRRAESLGVEVTGFESMCGIPLCLVPADLSRFLDLAEIPPGFDRGELLYAEPCQRCELRGRCFGIRSGYAELHGTGELRPVPPNVREAGASRAE